MKGEEAFGPENGKDDYLEDDLEEDAGRLIIYTIKHYFISALLYLPSHN
jgi:hypothetical protein